jgi:hypothetical protein
MKPSDQPISWHPEEYIRAAERLLADGAATEEVVRAFIESGYEKDLATGFVDFIDERIDFIIEQLEGGRLKAEVIGDLVADGWDERAAIRVVITVNEHSVQKEELEKSYRKERLRSILEGDGHHAHFPTLGAALREQLRSILFENGGDYGLHLSIGALCLVVGISILVMSLMLFDGEFMIVFSGALLVGVAELAFGTFLYFREKRSGM